MPRSIYSVPDKVRERVFLMMTNGKRNIECQRATGIDVKMAEVLRRHWKDHINPAGPQKPPPLLHPDKAGPWPPGWRKAKDGRGDLAAREASLRRKQQAKERATEEAQAQAQAQEEAPAPGPAAAAAVPAAVPPVGRFGGFPLLVREPRTDEQENDRQLREQYVSEKADRAARLEEKGLDKTLREYRKELRKALPIPERARILTELARAEAPQVALRAIELVDSLEGISGKVKDQAPAAPGPMIVLPSGSLMAIAPVRRDKD